MELLHKLLGFSFLSLSSSIQASYIQAVGRQRKEERSDHTKHHPKVLDLFFSFIKIVVGRIKIELQPKGKGLKFFLGLKHVRRFYLSSPVLERHDLVVLLL